MKGTPDLRELIKEHLELPKYLTNNSSYIHNHKGGLNLNNLELDMWAQNIMKIINTFNSNNSILKAILQHKLIKSRILNKTPESYNIPIDTLLNQDPSNNISYFYNNSLKKFKHKLGGYFYLSNNKHKFYFNENQYINSNYDNLLNSNVNNLIHSTQLNRTYNTNENITNNKLYNNLINIKKRISNIILQKLGKQKKQGNVLNIPNNKITNIGISSNRLTFNQFSWI